MAFSGWKGPRMKEARIFFIGQPNTSQAGIGISELAKSKIYWSSGPARSFKNVFRIYIFICTTVRMNIK